MIDETDKKIISELQEDGRKSLSSIARKIGQPPVSIWKRLQKLTKGDRIKISANVNTKELFPKTAIIEAEVKNYETISKLILKYKDCPRLIFISSFGGSSIVTILVGENLPTLKSCVGSCSVRIEEGIRRSEVKIGDHPLSKFLACENIIQ